MTTTVSTQVHALLAPWGGPQGERFGGLPPFDQASSAAIEAAVHAAMETKRLEIQAIVSNTSAPTFENTLEALEDSGRALKRVQAIASVFSATMLVGEMPAVAQRIAPLLSALEDEIAHCVSRSSPALTRCGATVRDSD